MNCVDCETVLDPDTERISVSRGHLMGCPTYRRVCPACFYEPTKEAAAIFDSAEGRAFIELASAGRPGCWIVVVGGGLGAFSNNFKTCRVLGGDDAWLSVCGDATVAFEQCITERTAYPESVRRWRQQVRKPQSRFKVGDRVKFTDPGEVGYGSVYRLTECTPAGWSGESDDGIGHFSGYQDSDLKLVTAPDGSPLTDHEKNELANGRDPFKPPKPMTDSGVRYAHHGYRMNPGAAEFFERESVQEKMRGLVKEGAAAFAVYGGEHLTAKAATGSFWASGKWAAPAHDFETWAHRCRQVGDLYADSTGKPLGPREAKPLMGIAEEHQVPVDYTDLGVVSLPYPGQAVGGRDTRQPLGDPQCTFCHELGNQHEPLVDGMHGSCKAQVERREAERVAAVVRGDPYMDLERNEVGRAAIEYTETIAATLGVVKRFRADVIPPSKEPAVAHPWQCDESEP